MDYPNFQTTNKKKYYLVGLIIALLLLSIAGWSFWKIKKIGFFSAEPIANYDYVISGVPAINLFNHQGKFGYIRLGDTVSSVISVLEYWNPEENDFTEISGLFNANTRKELVDHVSIRQFFDKFYNGKYTFKREYLSINELKKYLNPKVKTPLLLFFPLDKEQPSEITFHPLAVIVGIKESEKKLIMHNFFLGNNYEISFADFEKSWESMRSDERNAYFVVQPVKLKEKLKEVNSRKMEDYPTRISVMDEFSELLKNYAISRAMNKMGNIDLAMAYAFKAKDDLRFQEEVHPFYKMGVYYFLANGYLKKGDLELAKQFALLSVETDHDLDKPFKDWPGIEMRENTTDNLSEYSEPHRILGNVYALTDELDLAKNSYEKALEIESINMRALKSLNNVNTIITNRMQE